MIALVVTAYKLPDTIVNSFIENNHTLAREFAASIIVVTDAKQIIDAPCVWRVPAPEMEIFSICRCANIGIRRAHDLKASVIVKTDIDCILSREAWEILSNLKNGNGIIFRYWQVDSIADTTKAQLDPRIQGTCAFTAEDWLRIGGYNAQMQGYGYDDADIVFRARRSGIKTERLKRPKVYHIRHAEKHNRNTFNPVMRRKNMEIAYG